MKAKQDLSILFYLNRKKATRKGIPIYIRLTIDNQDCEISLGKKIRPKEEWDNEKKEVIEDTESARETNESISNAKKEITSHFTVLCANNDKVTPEMVKASYRPIMADSKRKHNREEYLRFSKRLDELITEYLQYLKNVRDEENNDEPRRKWERLAAIGAHGVIIKDRIEHAVEDGNTFFDDNLFRKTLLIAMDESLLHLLRNVQGEERSYQTLRRWRVTKNKLFVFCRHRYKKPDLFLDEVSYPLAGHLYTHFTLDDDLANNSAMKHIKNIKQIFDRAVTLQWIANYLLNNINAPILIRISYESFYDVDLGYWEVPGLSARQLGNASIGWERIYKAELALEMATRFGTAANISFYHHYSTNQLVQQALAGSTGFSSITANLPARVENTGVDFDISQAIMATNKMRWSTDFNIIIARNRLAYYPNLQTSPYAYLFAKGYAPDSRFVYDYTGVDPTTGLYTFRPVKQDGTLNQYDRVPVSLSPSFYGAGTTASVMASGA
jgi:hypothetical protein